MGNSFSGIHVLSEGFILDNYIQVESNIYAETKGNERILHFLPKGFVITPIKEQFIVKKLLVE